ncbi:MAG: hypothetical protein JOY71_23510 [Acetobacteraceae bacterium]|nr:hypothetical protein [Acetobacteraceae bacterium]
MPDRSSMHEWLNSVVAVVALLVSGVSVYFTWQSNQAKKEALATVARPTGTCLTEFHGGAEPGNIGLFGLCWSVTLANESESRLSIIDYRILSIQERGMGEIGGFHNLESADGSPLSLPLSLDGGEAKEIVVRAGIILPPAVAHAITQLPEYQSHTLSKLPLSAVQHALAMKKMDFVGNTVQPMLVDGKVTGFSIPPPIKRSVNLLVLTTGRGATFSARMAYPPEPG